MWKWGGTARMVLGGVVAVGLAGGCAGDDTGIGRIGAGRTGAAGAGGSAGPGGQGGGGGSASTGTGGAGAGTGASSVGGGFEPPVAASWNVSGGDAASGRASGGGVIHVVAQGTVTLGASIPAAPPVPAPPAEAVVVDAVALAADVAVAGSIRLDGALTAGGGGAVRRITSTGGDIFVSGTLRGGDAGGTARGLTLQAPGGTVYVSGALDASGANAGQGGGAIVIAAQRVVVTGALSTNGADGPSGGNAGIITIAAADLVFLGGSLETRGGAGTQAGGAGGLLAVDTAGAVQAAHLVDARGGAGVAGGALAGAPGGIHVGEKTAPSLVTVAVPVAARGGTGGLRGGGGGSMTFEPKMGNLVIAGSVDVDGGAATAQPGNGGTFVGQAGGDIQLVGEISGTGGAILAGGTGNGGVAGTVTIQPVSPLGTLVVSTSGAARFDGGASGGAGVAGGGGHLLFSTRGGDLTMAGALSLRGGDAPDPGGSGGLGGAVDIFSDASLDGIGGHLQIASSGVIDASGGAGTIGGSARNDGGSGVASFSDNGEMLAVLINCDGKQGTTQNWLDNRGMIIARGGAANGSGGDIAYHGISPAGDSRPPPGNIDNAGSGTGRPGDFAAE